MTQKSKVIIRRWRIEDIPGVIAYGKETYPDYPPEYIYTRRQYEMQLNAFLAGQFVAIADNKVVGHATSLIVNLEEDFWYTVDEITGAGTLSTHNPAWDTLYGADIAIHPDYRRRGIATMLYERRKGC